MALTSRLNISWHNSNVSTPSSLTPILSGFLVGPVATMTTAFVLIFLATIVSVKSKPSSPKGKQVPLLNPKRWFELSTARARRDYDSDSWNMTSKGMEAYNGEPFRLLMMELEGTETVVLPSRYADELKNDDRLSFTSLKMKGMDGTLPGFKAIGTLNQDNRIIQIVAQQDLTRSLPRLTPALSSECAVALEDAVGDGKEWHNVVVRSGVSLPLVARLSTLAFMGRESCYDREWIRIVIDFTVNFMLASMALRAYPRWLRALANHFLPECRVLRAQERRAREIIDEKLEARRELRDKEADVCSNSEAQPSTALDWFHSQHQRLGGEYNPTLVQLMMAFAAIHTTADLLTQAGQLVTTTPDFPAFGYGHHACPGRFFAAHEVKLVMCHMLLKYDWKIVDGADEPKWRAKGNLLDCDGLARIAICRRETGQEMTL